MIIFDSPYLLIQHDTTLQAITEEWKLDFTTTVRGDVFREPLLKLLQSFSDLQVSRWLCDNTEQKKLVSADQIWLETYFYPEIHKRGLRSAALVNTKNILLTGDAKNCLQNLSERALEIEVFNKNIPAREWLKRA
jgi:hypothetical protein